MPITVSVAIDRPIERVFEFMADFANNPKWQYTCLASSKVSEGPIGVRTAFVEQLRVMGMRGNVTLEVTEYEAPSKLGFKATPFGPIAPMASFTLGTADGATRVTLVANPNPRGPFKLLSPFISWWAAGLWNKHFRQLKKVLEEG